MHTDLLLKLVAFIRKIQRRGFAYFISTVTYYRRRHLYFFRIRIRETPVYRSCFSRFCSKPREPDRCCLQASHFRDRAYPKFHFDSNALSRIIQSVPEFLKSGVAAEGEKAFRQCFNFRDIASHTFEDAIDWQYAAGNHTTWLWDLNRHAYLVCLARAYHYTGEKKFIDKMIDLWSDWIEKNGPGHAANWIYPFEVAARLNNWIWCFFLLVYSEAGQSAPIRKFLGSLRVHADYLYANLELHWPNNHLLLEAKALLEFSILFPELDHKQKFFNRACKVFTHEITNQILKDGCHSELCSMYHLIVAGELKELFWLSRKNNLRIGDLTENKLKDILAFSDVLVREDGTIPLTGDSASDDNYIRFGLVERQKRDLDYWICHQTPTELDDRTEVAENLYLHCFSQSGYAFISERSAGRKVHITFDYGDFSRNPASDHAHCDALSFEVWANGKPLIMDPGVYFASENTGRWHQYFRSTMAHNTLMVDDIEQSRLWRHSDVKMTADTMLLKAEANPGQIVLEAQCLPYWSKRGEKVLHRRQLAYRLCGGLQISDRVEGAGVHNLKWFFHLAPGIEIQTRPDILTGFDRNGSQLFTLFCKPPDGPKLQIVHGSKDPLMGWVSLNSFQVQPVNTLIYSIDAHLPYACQFCIHIDDVQAI